MKFNTSINKARNNDNTTMSIGAHSDDDRPRGIGQLGDVRDVYESISITCTYSSALKLLDELTWAIDQLTNTGPVAE